MIRKFKKLISVYGLISICLFGLLYQTFLLIDEYLSGKTVINVIVGRLRNETPPAFTLCLPKYLSFEKAAKNDPGAKQLYINYIELSKNESIPQNDSMEAMEYLYMDLEDMFQYTNLSAHGILDKLSIPSTG